MRTIREIAAILKEYKNDYEQSDNNCMRIIGINVNTKNNMYFESLTINKKFNCLFIARRLKDLLKNQ